MKTLLVVEDDTTLADSLVEYLRPEGYALELARSIREAERRGLAGVDLVLLDWMLPDGSGIDLLRRWRQAGERLPVLMLTARTELVDRVLGLELGADDYVTKPFEPRELLARIRARLRAMEGPRPQARRLSFAGIELDVETRAVRYQGSEVELTRQELALLQLLLESPNRVFSREEILNQAWGYENYPTTRTVGTHVLQLRQKLDAAPFETIRGIGYRLREPKN